MIKSNKALLLLVLASLYGCGKHQPPSEPDKISGDGQSIRLSDTQMNRLKIATVGEHRFLQRSETVGAIAFNDEKTIQVFPSYQGKVNGVFAEIGQEVKKGQVLYTIDSPDMVQAESTLIATAGVKKLTSRALDRARLLYSEKGLAEKDLQQAMSDQQSAEGAYRAAVNAMRIFGKSDAEIEQIIATRKIDRSMPVKSPINGRVTAMNAPLGLLAQPGTPPAPFSVSDLSTMWMIANVPEKDIPRLHLGDAVRVRVDAYPDRIFQGKVTNIGVTVDPNTHTAAVRSEVKDPHHELHPGMFTTFAIQTGAPVQSVAVPLNGVVREGDGSMSVWVKTDRHRFIRRQVEIGVQQDGVDQILAGLHSGEVIATDGAIFLSNAVASASQ